MATCIPRVDDGHGLNHAFIVHSDDCCVIMCRMCCVIVCLVNNI